VRRDKFCREERVDGESKPGIPFPLVHADCTLHVYVSRVRSSDRAYVRTSARNIAGDRVDLAVRQDSLNGVWISSEKSSREPIEPSSERKRMKRSTRDGDKGGELREEREREREREEGGGRGDVSLLAPPHLVHRHM